MSLTPSPKNGKVAVILDTDIGTDIDDTWALAFLLRCPELDVKLITTVSGDTYERAKIAAKLLEVVGRTDIPIGIGVPLENTPIYQSEWVQRYRLGDYRGEILQNGIQAMADVIQQASEPVTVIGIGPLPNIASLLMQAPDVVHRSRFVGMFGSLRKGYFGSEVISAEYNVKLYPHACRKVFSTRWGITISPLDTCGLVQLKGEKYRIVRESRDPLVRAVMENYDCWTKYNRNPLYRGFDPGRESSILYDLVPVYLAFSEAFLDIEELKITVSEDGYTRIDGSGDQLRCTTTWKNLAAFEELVISRLTGR